MCGLGAASPFGVAAGLLVLVLVAALAMLAVQASRPPVPARVAEWAPIEILKERYARGEIDHDELDRRLGHLLRSGDPGPWP